MPRPFTLIASSLVAATALAAVVAAQQPQIANARLTAQPAGSPFAQSFRTLIGSQPDVWWIGYSVPAVSAERVMCCSSGTTWINGDVIMTDRAGCCGACRLEQTTQVTQSTAPAQSTAPGPIKLEGSTRMVVLYRVVDRRVERIRIFSEECQLDAGGRPVQWLESVRTADSIALLESFVTADTSDRRTSENAISAIAMHGDAAADAALDRLVAPASPEATRKKVTFWLGNARGRHGLDTLKRLLRDDASDEVRKSAVFGVSQSRERDAFDTLTSIARSDRSDRIRSEAVFWTAQTNDSRAPAAILESLQKDASLEVRKKAVFALSQLKDDRGVPELMQVARSSDTPTLRGEAIFWLGQKAGARAASAITERIDQDPDTEVKKRAVFALSQLPKDEGIPLLINVARTNPNPAVKKQAIFWLGQSRDPRAIDYFAEVLGK
jgi:HEAT repeat protein